MNFNDKCYKIISQISKGKISTYKNIANPFIVPCHRIIKSNGKIGGYALGINKKICFDGIISRGRFCLAELCGKDGTSTSQIQHPNQSTKL